MKSVAMNGPQPRAELKQTRSIRAGVIPAVSTSDSTWHTKLGAVMTSAALMLSGCADMPVFHSAATTVGYATTPAEGADFVQASRPKDLDYTPVGVEPSHQAEKPRDAAGVKKLQSELEAQRDAGHAILQKLSPGAAAAEDAKEKAKAAAKKKPQGTAAAKPKNQTQDQAPASQ